MTHAKHVPDEQLERFYQALADAEDLAQVKMIMEDLCTIKEVNEMAQRLYVAELLNDGESYAAIQEKTGASATTIARVSKCLNYGSGGYRLVLEKTA